MAASEKLEAAYRLVPKDTLWLFHAAQSAVKGKDYKRALTYYTQLINMGFNGVIIDYMAVNKKTGEMEMMPEKMRDSVLKIGLYRDPLTQKSESKKPVILNHIAQIYHYFEDYEKALNNYLLLLGNGISSLDQETRTSIYNNIAEVYIAQNKKGTALDFMKTVRRDHPKDINADFIKNEASLYLHFKDIDMFVKLLNDLTRLEPNNPNHYYNLGVVTADSGDLEGAKAFYNRAIALDPTYVNALTNMAALILEKEGVLIDEMNGLGSSDIDNKRYDQLKELRKQVFKEAIPYLEAAFKIDKNAMQSAQTLMNIYESLGDTFNRDRIRGLLK
nr:tetratricopeptide repeat protein [Arenibacter sp. F26102]